MPHFPHIEGYRAQLTRAVVIGGSRNEGSVRHCFAGLLRKYCASAELTLAEEIQEKTGGKTNIPDGVVKTVFRLDHGHWEAKDEKDDLDREITAKFRRGYPRFNILFENTQTAILFQNGKETLRADMKNDAQLDKILRAFVDYRRPEIVDFRKALAQFKVDLPDILEVLRRAISQAQSDNKEFAAASREFLALCQETINPNVGADDIREMLIQHILTADIFRKIFGEEQFHSENNIAQKLEKLARTFFNHDFRRNTVDKLKTYYAAIVRAAADLTDYREKQKFLKAVYEEFYRVYNPKAADRLGVVYTPSEVVNFMVRATDQLVHKHFGRRLWDDHVQILDPSTGTGTFVTELIDFFPVANLRDKYPKELHANEVAILPYYIANLNIEHAYKARVGEYCEFPGICFVDTLDNQGFKGGGKKTERSLGGIAAENMERIRRQNERKISVVIGNPPWNANQMNENENNKNRKYPAVDARVKATYIKESTAQKTKLYDMYTRFVRWASDRIGVNGVLAFVTNSSFIDAKGFDGFRKAVATEFNELHIIDMKGNVFKSGDKLNLQGGNIFNVKVGVAIWFFVRNTKMRGCQIWHCPIPDKMSAADKLALLFPNKTLDNLEFRSIVPDSQNRWVGQTDNDFGKLIPLVDKKTKAASAESGQSAIFKLYSFGPTTARDHWVYDFDRANLSSKMQFFVQEYEAKRAVFGGAKSVDPESLGRIIKWTRHLKKQLRVNLENRFLADCIRQTVYRPFTSKWLYFSHRLNEMLYRSPEMFPEGKKGENRVICFSESRRMSFAVFACDSVPAYSLFVEPAQCIPLYRYNPLGERQSNITGWGLKQFQEHYGDAKIKAEDIFHYAYGVLHSPSYREKYGVDLQQELPRLPFYADFCKWVKWGTELMELHLDFENAKSFPLIRLDSEGDAGRAKLLVKQEDGRIVVDEKTTLDGIPPEAWEYKLGGRSALEWVLDQHKEKKVKDPTVAAKFPPSPFSDRKENVIELLRRVCTVSVETVKIIRKMESKNR